MAMISIEDRAEKGRFDSGLFAVITTEKENKLKGGMTREDIEHRISWTFGRKFCLAVMDTVDERGFDQFFTKPDRSEAVKIVRETDGTYSVYGVRF